MSLLALKLTTFLVPYLELRVSFSSNFASLFRVMRHNSSVLFHLKIYMIWTEIAHQSAKFQIFDCSREISPNLLFDRLLLLKVYKIAAKKAQRSYVSWQWRVMQKLRKTDLLFQKGQKFGEFWHKYSKVSNISTLIVSFCAKYIMFDI